MSPEEAAIDKFDAPEKAFKLPDAGEPQRELSDAARRLLLDDEPELEEDTPADDDQPEDGKKPKIVDDYSATIQSLAEEAYATAVIRAEQDPSILDSLLGSDDKVKKRLAQKLIERNSHLFGGAKSIDEYTKNKAIASAGDDPVQKKLAEQDHELKSIRSRQESQEWEAWKKDRNITGDFATIVDQVHSEYPSLPREKAVALAKGLSDSGAVTSSKGGASMPVGGGSAAEQEDITTNRLAKKLLRDPKSTKKFFSDPRNAQFLG